jgi:hypothetical protein
MTPRQDLANARLAELMEARIELRQKAYRAFADPRVSANPSDAKHAAFQAQWDELETHLKQAIEECRLANIEAANSPSNPDASQQAD